jgi:hypothetical protein
MTVQTDESRLRMSLLGRFEVRAGDAVIIDEVWQHRNAKALLNQDPGGSAGSRSAPRAGPRCLLGQPQPVSGSREPSQDPV